MGIKGFELFVLKLLVGLLFSAATMTSFALHSDPMEDLDLD